MANIEAVSAVATTAATEAPDQGNNAELQQAFAQGVVKFMGSMLQSMEGDIIESINDNTSTPDSPN